MTRWLVTITRADYDRTVLTVYAKARHDAQELGRRYAARVGGEFPVVSCLAIVADLTPAEALA